jgi:hypothetical protein
MLAGNDAGSAFGGSDRVIDGDSFGFNAIAGFRGLWDSPPAHCRAGAD